MEPAAAVHEAFGSPTEGLVRLQGVRVNPGAPATWSSSPQAMPVSGRGSESIFRRFPRTGSAWRCLCLLRTDGGSSMDGVRRRGWWAIIRPKRAGLRYSHPLVAATAHLEDVSQLFVRAAIYRLVTSLLSNTVDPLGVDRITDLATELAG